MAETRIYRCNTPCTWLKRYWRVGSIYEGTETPTAHFELVGTATDPEPEEPTGGGCHCAENIATDAEYDEMLADVGLLPSTGAA